MRVSGANGHLPAVCKFGCLQAIQIGPTESRQKGQILQLVELQAAHTCQDAIGVATACYTSFHFMISRGERVPACCIILTSWSRDSTWHRQAKNPQQPPHLRAKRIYINVKQWSIESAMQDAQKLPAAQQAGTRAKVGDCKYRGLLGGGRV